MSTPEEIRYDGQQQQRVDKRREMLERRARMGGPEAPEPCDPCDGEGFTRETYPPSECPHCLGAEVQS